MLNYNHLYYFHVAASEGSLSAAAAKLGVKPSTVSEQLRALERALRLERRWRPMTRSCGSRPPPKLIATAQANVATN